jgi:hypothetical protein
VEGARATENLVPEREVEMSILRIEHPVPDYDAWKQAFDSDPVGREKSGVRRYQVLRAIDDPNYVMIDLEFDTPGEAETMLAAMRVVWDRVQGKIMSNPQAQIVEVAEAKEY